MLLVLVQLLVPVFHEKLVLTEPSVDETVDKTSVDKTSGFEKVGVLWIRYVGNAAGQVQTHTVVRIL